MDTGVIGNMSFNMQHVKSHVAKEILGRGRKGSREKGNQGVRDSRYINILQHFSMFFNYFIIFSILFLPTTFTHTHDQHPYDLYPLPTTFSYTQLQFGHFTP